MQEAVCSISMVIGAIFMCIAGLGILRMPDLFMRMSAATKASTMGVGFLLISVAIKYPVIEIISRSMVIIVFVLLTAPVAAHMIGRAAYMTRVPLWKGSIIDELCAYYERCGYTFEDEPDSTELRERMRSDSDSVP